MLKEIEVKEGETTSVKKCVTFCSYKKYPFYLGLFHPEKKKKIAHQELEQLRRDIQKATIEFLRKRIQENFQKLECGVIAESLISESYSEAHFELFFHPGKKVIFVRKTEI